MAVDFSGCVEMSDDFFGFNYSTGGKVALHFDATGAADEKMYGKDSTSATDITKSTFHIEQMQLSCSSGLVRIKDGSNGAPLLAVGGASGTGGGSVFRDFGNDPILCLTSEFTQSLCLSSAANCHWSCDIKGFWGVE
jgi:hypothetical protein